jgi:Zn-dependent protease with chaperone function
MATYAVAPVCPQGHGAGTPGSKFCRECGAPLVVPAGAAVAPVATAPVATVAVPVATVGVPVMSVPVAVAPTPSPFLPPGYVPPSYVPVAAGVPAAAGAVPAPYIPPPPVAGAPVAVCKVCGGNGLGLGTSEVICSGCGWLRPLIPGYQLDRAVFLWAQDGQAMAKLQSISALNSILRSASDKVGRPWIESTFNGIRMGPRQLPDVWKLAVQAARILGLSSMPDVYVAGDQMWNTYTFGSDTSAFIVLGTAILTNFSNDELLFVLAREMGHCRAGHAIWKTATRFLTGGDGTHSGPLSQGIMGVLSPTKLVEGAVDMPLMAWQRQSEITADRAGLLAVGDEALARRVLLAWSIRSARLLKQVNIEEWMKQEDASNDSVTRFSEMTTSSSMYTTRRLRLLGQAAKEASLMQWSQHIQGARKTAYPPPPAPPPRAAATAARAGAPGARPAAAPGARPAAGSGAGPAAGPSQADSIRVVCNKCQAAMRVPLAVLRGKASLNIRCPQCQNILTLRPKPAAAAPSPAPAGAAPKPVAQTPLTAAAKR